jgi:26 proteasome complex subunit DSS1
MADASKAVDLGLLEEDDEFEEFPSEEWDTKDEDQSDINVWEDKWDDDTVQDDFSVQLRNELANQGVKMET